MPSCVPCTEVTVGEWRRVGEREGSEDVRGGAVQHLGQTEIEHLDRAVHRSLDVVRLEVAVHDPLLVRLLQSLGDLAGDGDRLLDGRGPLRSRSASVGPGTSSMTSARRPPDSSRPKMEAMCG
jgi:hypothetical protein